MPQEATVRNLPQAYRVIKQMRLNGWEVAEEYREAARAAIRRCLRQRMLDARDQHLEQMASRASEDRANGSSHAPFRRIG